MKVKWYLSTLVIILTLLGVGQQQITVPNQEIVVQFTDEANFDVTQDAIEIVKTQLLNLGADNIQVIEEESSLRITYYSEVDVASIKELLSSKKSLDIGYSTFNKNQSPSNLPSRDNSNGYNLDVYEIQKGNEYDLDFDGFVLEQKPENPRYFSPNLYFSNSELDIKERHRFKEVKYLAQRNSAIATNNTTRKIPEVRAGPKA